MPRAFLKATRKQGSSPRKLAPEDVLQVCCGDRMEKPAELAATHLASHLIQPAHVPVAKQLCAYTDAPMLMPSHLLRASLPCYSPPPPITFTRQDEVSSPLSSPGASPVSPVPSPQPSPAASPMTSPLSSPTSPMTSPTSPMTSPAASPSSARSGAASPYSIEALLNSPCKRRSPPIWSGLYQSAYPSVPRAVTNVDFTSRNYPVYAPVISSPPTATPSSIATPVIAATPNYSLHNNSHSNTLGTTYQPMDAAPSTMTSHDADIQGRPRFPWEFDPSSGPETKPRRNEPPRFTCEGCGKSYATFSGLSKHKRFHCALEVKKEFTCKFCDKKYNSMGAMKMHVRTHTLPCKCPLCGKAFSRPWLLQGHIRTHTGEKPFKCDDCGRSFADRSNLRAHLQTHTDVKKYHCKSCSKSFSRMSLVTKHQENCCGKTEQ